MKRLSIVIILLITLSSNIFGQKGREQWTEKEAWEWQKRVGEIKGFNEPVAAYPGMSRQEIFQKAAGLGFNSVRFFVFPTETDEQIKYIREMAEDANAFGLTVSPVLPVQYVYFPQKANPDAFQKAKECTQQIVRTFANDSRIVLWDVWNEPNTKDSPEMYDQMDWIEAIVGWCREMAPIQPITSSIFWDTDLKADSISSAIARRNEVEAMMDIHNFHDYNCADDYMKNITMMIKRLQQISNRPIVCTEAIARTTGSTVARSLIGFSRYHVNFFTWGLYMCDMNWSVSWGRSSYEPFEPMFHELLHPDGEPYDRRELAWLRNFHFAQEDELVDPGAEFTERWTKDRAWKWMVTGPVKGIFYSDKKISDITLASHSSLYNGLRIKCDYGEWKKDANSFYKKMDNLLSSAVKPGIRIVPALLTDDYVNEKDTVLAIYVAQVIKRYATDPRIQAWEIYTHPGREETDTDKLFHLLRLLFRFARFEFPNQPLTATPWLRVKKITVDFNYKEALIHGKMNGWNYLICEGGSTPKLCNLIWKLSDIVSFSSNQKAAETGWLTSIAYRYGRPVICTEWCPPDRQAEKETLEVFSQSHVFWYCSRRLWDNHVLKKFQFKGISTPIQ